MKKEADTQEDGADLPRSSGCLLKHSGRDRRLCPRQRQPDSPVTALHLFCSICSPSLRQQGPFRLGWHDVPFLGRFCNGNGPFHLLDCSPTFE